MKILCRLVSSSERVLLSYISSLLVCFVFLIVASSHAEAQGAKKVPAAKKAAGKAEKDNKGKKANAAPDLPVPNPNLESVDFAEALIPDEPAVVDPDETPEGKRELERVTQRAQVIYKEIWDLFQERRPLALQRDSIVVQILQLYETGGNLEEQIGARNSRIGFLKQVVMVDSKDNASRNEINVLSGQLTALIAELARTQESVKQRMPDLIALNNQLAPIDVRLVKLWTEGNECRKQWLAIRVPEQKYARAEFEKLKQVTNDWSRIDGFWPQNYCWNALCAFELGEYDAAIELVDKVDKMRVEVYYSKKKWAHIEAMKALVCLKHPKLKSKFDEYVREALKATDKQTDWATPYFVGLCYAQKAAQVKKSDHAKKALGFFKRSLDLNPRSMIVRYRLAELQLTDDKTVADVEGATTQLETLWARTGKRSWRVGFLLAKAYAASDRSAEAKSMLDAAIALAPTAEHTRMRESLKRS